MSSGRAPWRYTMCDPWPGDEDGDNDLPLDYDPDSYGGNPQIIDADGNKVVGHGEYHVFGEVNRVDNVRLLLAAPKLLAMLEQIADAEYGFGEWPSEAEVRMLLTEAKGNI